MKKVLLLLISTMASAIVTTSANQAVNNDNYCEDLNLKISNQSIVFFKNNKNLDAVTDVYYLSSMYAYKCCNNNECKKDYLDLSDETHQIMVILRNQK